MTQKLRIGIALCFAVAISVIVGISAYISMAQVVDANRWTTHTHVVLEKLDHLLGVITDAETGQRGYILTGEPQYLEKYTHADKLSGQDLDALKELTRDNPAQQETLVQLRNLSNARLAHLRSTVAVRDKSGLDAAINVIRTGTGKRMMDDLRALIITMQGREKVLLQIRSDAVTASSKRAMGVIAIWFPLLAILAILLTRLSNLSQHAPLFAPPEQPFLKGAIRYLFAVVIVCVATVLRQWCGRAFEPISPFIFFFPAVLMTAGVAGSGAGLAATVLSSFAAAYFFLDPRGSFAVSSPSDLLALAIFTGTNVFTCIVVDRLQKSRAADAIARQTEHRFRMIVDAIDQLAWTGRADGFLEWYNQRWYEYTGTTPRDMEGWGWQSVHDPSVLQSVLERWKASIATGQPFEMVFPLRGADGQFRSFLTRSQPRKDAKGNVVQWLGTCTDVDDIKRAEEASMRLAAIVESSDDAILSQKLDGTIVSWNAAAERLFGYPAQEIVGQPFLLLVPPERIDETANISARLRRGEGCDRIETLRLTKDGRKIDVSITISPLRDGDGNVVGASTIARDITDRKRDEDAVAAAMQAAEQAKIAAEAANKTKDRFIAVLSHELRTPLNPVLVSVSMLLKDPRFDADVCEQLEMIYRNVELETRLIDDLLDVTRIAGGKVRLDRRPVDVNAIIQSVTQLCNLDVVAKNLKLSVEVPPTSIWLDGDAARVQQILWNVLRNAIKFTPPGNAVHVRVSAEKEGFSLIQVSDTGIGIDPSRLGRIFNAFEQVDDVMTQPLGGIGLGLSISKGLVELHGGTITVRSDGDGKGATFAVRIPLATADLLQAMERSATAVAPLPKLADRSLRILLVEDHVDTAKIMGRMLRSHGFNIDHAPDVATAMKLLADNEYDLLLSDLGLPDGNGRDIMRGLRDRGSNLPGIALSGFGQDVDIKNSIDAGFTAHFTKPVNINLLITKVQEIAER